MSKSIDELERENAELRGIVEQVLYMARRYADGTTSTAPHTVNTCIRKAGELGIVLPPDTTLQDPAGRLVTDGSLGRV